ncbi:MAG: hypothetical protein ACREGD_02215 [Candidatus Saccharimonadales bacterium]
MTTAEQILVVFLSTALAVFLVIAIIAGIQTIRLLRTLQNVATKAESFVTSAEAVGQVVKQTVGALSLSRFAKGVVNFVHNKQQDERKGGDKQ